MMERVLCLLIGYACGLFQTSYLIGKKNHIDIRQHGSGNAGTTNALRTLGKKAGALTLVGDCLKCILAMLLAKLIFQSSCGDYIVLLTLYAAAGTILGHNFPFYLGFKGGKGVAASVGMVVFFDWKIFLVCFVVFFGLFFWKHYVSLCSLASYSAAMLLMILFGQMGYYGMNQAYLWELYGVMAALTILAFYRHRANIGRLLNGTENKIILSKTK